MRGNPAQTDLLPPLSSSAFSWLRPRQMTRLDNTLSLARGPPGGGTKREPVGPASMQGSWGVAGTEETEHEEEGCSVGEVSLLSVTLGYCTRGQTMP